MAGSSHTTTDHNEIRKWAEERGGKPATIKRTESDGEASVLRIDFPGYSGAGSLEEISWEEFFAKFDEKNLSFLYQDTTSSGEESRFFKLVSRETAEDKSHRKTTSKAHKTEDKPHKTEHKMESKAHKTEDKSHAKSSKTEDKSHTKATAKSHKK